MGDSEFTVEALGLEASLVTGADSALSETHEVDSTIADRWL